MDGDKEIIKISTMKKHRVLVVLLALVVVSGFAQSKTEQLVLDLSKKKFDWLIDKQYDSLGRLLDDQLTYIHSNGWCNPRRKLWMTVKAANWYTKKWK